MIIKIKEKILNRFIETKAEPNHCIDQRWIMHSLLTALNPKEKEEFESAIKELIDEGLVKEDNRAGMYVLVLTQKGFDTIYQTNSAEIIIKIKDKILRQFTEMQAEPNHCIDQRWIMHSLLTALNPKEKEEFELAIKELIDEGLVKEDNRAGMYVLVLTQKGFDTIY